MILSPLVKQRFFDSNGVPLTGGLLYTYQAGTSTPQVTYSNQAGTTNTNPVVLDAYGYADVWLDPTKAYKFILQDVNGNVLWTLDNIAPVSGGINDGTASVSFSSGILVVNQALNTPATVQCGSIKVGNTGSAISNFCTISPVNSLSANYNLVLPPVSPSGTQLLTIDASGNINPNAGTVSATVANNIASQMSATGANAIGSVMSATGANAVGASMTSTGANAVANSRTRSTGTSVGLGGVAVSASSGSTTLNGTNILSITLVTSGRPVFVGLIDDGGGSGSGLNYNSSGVTILFHRGSTTIVSAGINTSASGVMAVSLFNTIDFPSAGTNTYNIAGVSGGGTCTLNNARLIAYEL